MPKITEVKSNYGHQPLNTFIIPFVWTNMIEKCVDNIWKFCDQSIHRLILIDNTGENSEIITRLQKKSHLYIKSYRNLGGPKGWNIGVKIADTKYITLIGDDTLIVHRSWWENTYKLIKGKERVVFSKNIQNLIANNIVEFKEEYSDEEYGSICAQLSGGRGYIFHTVTMERDLLEEIGYFPEDKYPTGYLDSWFKKKAEGSLCPDVAVIHQIGGSNHANYPKNLEGYQEISERPEGRLQARRHPMQLNEKGEMYL